MTRTSHETRHEPRKRPRWQWKILRCPHCREELRTRIICVNAEREIDVLQDERDFLLARLVRDDADWVGASSSAMVVQALTGAGEPACWPFDGSDLRRCEETYRRAPAHLKPLMLPTLERFRKRVARAGG